MACVVALCNRPARSLDTVPAGHIGHHPGFCDVCGPYRVVACHWRPAAPTALRQQCLGDGCGDALRRHPVLKGVLLMLEYEIVLGKSRRGEFLRFGGSEHVALHARSGAGKTSSFTIPNCFRVAGLAGRARRQARGVHRDGWPSRRDGPECFPVRPGSRGWPVAPVGPVRGHPAGIPGTLRPDRAHGLSAIPGTLRRARQRERRQVLGAGWPSRLRRGGHASGRDARRGAHHVECPARLYPRRRHRVAGTQDRDAPQDSPALLAAS